MLAFLNTPTFPVFSPPTYFNPSFILRFYLSFIFYLAFIYCVLLFANIIYHVMRTDTCNKPHTLRDAVTGRKETIDQWLADFDAFVRQCGVPEEGERWCWWLYEAGSALSPG